MKCKYLFLFTLFEATKKTHVLGHQKHCTSSRSGLFVTKENKQFNGHVVESFESPSLLSCSHSCMRTAWCTSTNFKLSSKYNGKGTCELNKHDISQIKENTNVQEKEGVIFSTLSQVNQYYSNYRSKLNEGTDINTLLSFILQNSVVLNVAKRALK